ncbi:MAG TPA: hypothetical protein VF628_13325 [Allosphingosinicella sp.]|jgi:hypothetical protein
MTNGLTYHAALRAQQRRVPQAIIEWLFQFGSVEPQNGSELLHFDKQARHRLARAIGKPVVARLGRLLDTYAVVSGGEVVTLGYRYKRIRHR